MKYQKHGVRLTRDEWSVLSTIAERVLNIMEEENPNVWRDQESVLIQLTDEEMKLACDCVGSDQYKKYKHDAGRELTDKEEQEHQALMDNLPDSEEMRRATE